MLSAEATASLIEWTPVSSRIVLARLRSRARNVQIVQCYAPTNDADGDVKTDFYEQLQATLEQRTKRDILIVMGDFNAQIGSDNVGREHVMGREGLGQINELFADFCSFNNIVIGGSLFRHKRIHKATWISPDHHTENQIDHITICKEFRRSLQDKRVRRGADAASDHHLVVGRLKLKLKRFFKTSPKPSHRYNTALLKDATTRDTFTLELSNRFQALHEHPK